MNNTKKVSAFANANIALVKYWGKANADLNISSTSSISLTLDGLGTKMVLCPSPEPRDILQIDERFEEGEAFRRVQQFLECVRREFQVCGPLLIQSYNCIPYASGLASSASSYAALTLCLNSYFALGLNQKEQSILARKGSGSAARSIHGGFVMLRGGASLSDGEAFAEPVSACPTLDLSLLIVECARGQKSTSSREGMERTRSTSPFYAAWLENHGRDMEQALSALKEGNFCKLGEAMERSTLKMHATMATSIPALVYAQPVTLRVLQEVVQLRNQGHPCFFTMDAGPHVKVLCPKKEAAVLEQCLRAIPEVHCVRHSLVGPGAQLIGEVT